MSTQLMCIVTPEHAGTDQQVIAARALFDRLFKHVGCVHFAAFALLPPSPGEVKSTLVLELAVDPGIAPDELLERLLQHGLGALVAIYECDLQIPARSSQLVLQDHLRTFLRRQMRIADGGFVGQRDRTVGQIIAEARLYQAARKWLHENRKPYEERKDVAQRLADWAIGQPEWAWAAAPPSRSWLRSVQLSAPLRALVLLARADAPMPGLPVPGAALLAVVLLAVTALAFTGVLALAPFAAVVPWLTLIASPQVFGCSGAWAPWAVGVVLIIAALGLFFYWMMISTARLVTVAAFFMLALGTLLAAVLLAAFVVLAWRDDFNALLGFAGAIEVLVRTGVLAFVVFAFLWAVIVAIWAAALRIVPPYFGMKGIVGVAVVLSAAAAWSIHFGLASLVEHGAAMSLGLYPELSAAAWWGVPALDVIIVLEFLGFSLMTGVLTHQIRLPPFARFKLAGRLDRIDPKHRLVRGHQIHKKIVECEAELAHGRVSHMFSLTDVRRNFGVKHWLHYFLRLVTLVGHTIFTEGKLAHAEGIRFAHWYVIDGKRLLFCSNFDGGFGGYLDEFINGASEGINLFWRWTELRERPSAAPGHPAVMHARAFPPTRLGVFRGCKYEQWFKTYARDSMLPHLYRFEAYPYTALDVQRATRVREALFGARTAVNDDKLLRGLES